MRAEHGLSTERPRARATASRAPPRPAGGSHARPKLPTTMCGMFSGSTMRPHNGLRQSSERVAGQHRKGAMGGQHAGHSNAV